MKKIAVCIMAIFLSSTFFPVQSNAATTPESTSAVVPKPAESSEAKALLLRLDEINSMEKSKLNSSDKKNLRIEVRTTRHKLREIGGGVYLSASAILLIDIAADYFVLNDLKIKIMSSGKILLSVLAGVAVGALLGVLFAPDKGSETRKKISKKGKDYADALTEKFNEFLDDISEKFEKVNEEVTDFIEPGKSKAAEVKKDMKTTKV